MTHYFDPAQQRRRRGNAGLPEQNRTDRDAGLLVFMVTMSSGSVLLCIHRQPSELSLLHKNGYELAVATNTSEGLRLLQARPVDAVLIDYELCQSEGAGLAHQIKHFRPDLPIIMLVEHLELPGDALQAADALVAKSDGDHFLWATVHFLLNVKPVQRQQRLKTLRAPRHRGGSPGDAS